MSIICFIAGVIILIQQGVPPALLGGSIKHFVPSSAAKQIGVVLLLPLFFDMCYLLGIISYMFGKLSIIWVLAAYLWPIIAIVIYYNNRVMWSLTPGTPIPGTDIPFELADLGQRIAKKTYRSFLLLGLALYFPLTYLFAPLAIWWTTQDIRLSNKHQIARKQRMLAHVLRVIAIVMLIAPTVCCAIMTFAGPQINDALIAANLLEPFPTVSPTPDFGPTWTAVPTPKTEVERIVFASDRNDSNWDIYSINPDGTDEVRLTTEEARDLFPAWSPDGQQIIFVSDRDGEYLQLYRMDAYGSNVVKLTSLFGDVLYPSWSPDGEKIALTYQDGETYERAIYVFNADGTEPERLGPGERASWSPDSSQLAYEYEGIYVINADGSNPTRIVHDSISYQAAWSPDGRWIAYLAGQTDFGHVALIRSDGQGVSVAVTGEGYSSPSWSPDSQQLVCESNEGSLYIVNVDGSGLTPLVITSNNEAPAWQQP